jgi:hypothetical protein
LEIAPESQHTVHGGLVDPAARQTSPRRPLGSGWIRSHAAARRHVGAAGGVLLRRLAIWLRLVIGRAAAEDAFWIAARREVLGTGPSSIESSFVVRPELEPKVPEVLRVTHVYFAGCVWQPICI